MLTRRQNRFRLSGLRTGNPAGRSRSGRKNFTQIRDEFLFAFEEMGGCEALVKWAETNPDQFYKLVFQLLPKEKTADMTSHTTTLEDLLLEINHENDQPPPSD